MDKKIGIIGCGKMAYAIAKGLFSASSFYQGELIVHDIDKEKEEKFHRELGAKIADLASLIAESEVIILAVKPGQIGEVLEKGRGFWQEDKLIISVAASIKTSFIEKVCGIPVPVIRVMPNTPALVGKGVAVLCRGSFALPEHLDIAGKIFAVLGVTRVVEEKMMDAVTAVSGSGPAYFYLAAEAMINAGVEIGLDWETARFLVVNTLKGSAAMLEETGEHPALLREAVCSPGGTTIAAVRKLEENGMRRAFFEAVESAYKRARELGKD
ncbi:pyrroline-5-carboxylate reductase [Thermosyntropha lipolytica DSM 11003]|uniref:Pyrroline-5-carboxylate reductase n=1 Tax=Thermosyntropha lipolytica DSM 11003 TaxID=1123382 RepID=A0A1M5KAA8_9FIRM|nr:pyrroline-5-carboxylate reductase [Thermosyntropha lipolytica]SHG49123.1 pyrroline-5-carboxylate reductase [Thermosyntropha lipolytica DSM 11003]